MRKAWAACRPLVSRLRKPLDFVAKRVAVVVSVGAIAIGGANLGTYFDYTYNNYPRVNGERGGGKGNSTPGGPPF